MPGGAAGGPGRKHVSTTKTGRGRDGERHRERETESRCYCSPILAGTIQVGSLAVPKFVLGAGRWDAIDNATLVSHPPEVQVTFKSKRRKTEREVHSGSVQI